MIEDILSKINLIPSETKIYLALLELGPQGANILAKKTNIKRANVYYFLESLREKGLVTEFTDMSGIKHFRPEDPEKLVKFIENQEEKLKQQKELVNHIIPELKALSQKGSYKIPKVRYYEGKKAIEGLYKEIFSFQEILTIANIDAVGNIFPYYIWNLPKIISFQKMKELICNTKSAKNYKKELEGKNHEIKILPKEYFFETDILIFDKKVAFISYRQVITAFVIEDILIYMAQKNIFEGLYKIF